MKKLSGKESREKLIAEIRSLLPGRKLSIREGVLCECQ